MRSTYGGWVLNLGGRYGTPGIADEKNIVRVGGGGRRVARNPELLVLYNSGSRRRRNSVGAGVEFNVRKHRVRRSEMRRRRRNLPLTVRRGRRKSTWKGLVKRFGVKRAAKMWRKSKKYHGYSRTRVANRRRRRRKYNSWKGHKAAHRRAARKGWRKRSRRGRARRKYGKRRKGCRARKGSIKYGKCYFSRAALRRKIGKRRMKKLLKRRGR
jgi:hypothetical protein